MDVWILMRSGEYEKNEAKTGFIFIKWSSVGSAASDRLRSGGSTSGGRGTIIDDATDAGYKSDVNAGSDPITGGSSDAKSNDATDAKFDVNTDIKSDGDTDVKPNAKSNADTDTKSDADIDTKSDPDANTKPDFDTESKSDLNTKSNIYTFANPNSNPRRAADRRSEFPGRGIS